MITLRHFIRPAFCVEAFAGGLCLTLVAYAVLMAVRSLIG